MHNADLCDTFGNGLNRAIKLCIKDCKGVVPDVPPPANNPLNLDEIITNYTKAMDEFDLQGGANVAIQGFRDVNRYLQEEAPWLKKGDEHAEFRQTIIRAALEAIYANAHLLLPFLPIGCKQVFSQLGTKPTTLDALNRDCRNLKAGTPIQAGKVLYAKSLLEDSKDKKKETHAEAQARKKEKKAKEAAASKAAAAADNNQPEFTKMDIRVGKITKVWNHENADKLFCETIDVGEESGPREIASGLRGHYALEDMQDRLVLVVCNLKAAKIVGFTSNGMVLAAKVCTTAWDLLVCGY